MSKASAHLIPPWHCQQQDLRLTTAPFEQELLSRVRVLCCNMSVIPR